MQTDIAAHGLKAKVGTREFPVESWQQVSGAYRRALDHAGLGASEAPLCLIIDDARTVIAHVSYNGKVWPGGPAYWWPGLQPIYCP